MRTEGIFAPQSSEEAHEAYEIAGPVAQTVLQEVARAMNFDREEYHTRVTSEVVETARDAVFASLLTVYVGDRTEFDDWCADHPDYDVQEVGTDSVPQVVWHPVPFAETVVAATFRDEPEAAIATLRRQVFGRVYREEF
jgi:hypothetical protein